MVSTPDLIRSTLLQPLSIQQLSEPQWDLLIRQGRRANLLGRLAYTLNEQELLSAVPKSPRLHLSSAFMMVEQQHVSMRWEVECICSALFSLEIPIILLKGAAYLLAKLPVACGRNFSDVDILIPKSHLSKVESQLIIHGWKSTHHDQYDQRYYRKWMHEIPPMRHMRRGTTIDVHHAILPETARIKVNTPALLEAAVALSGFPNLFVLRPTDMVLHSATHLFHEGELENGLRDLFDLDSLLRHFGPDPGFWDELVPRAVELGLTRPLYYAISLTTSMLDTPVPPHVVRSALIGKPTAVIASLMDYCYQRALRPVHVSCDTSGTRLSRPALYIRSHWIRMPFPLLAYHLAHKAIRRQSPLPFETPTTQADETT